MSYSHLFSRCFSRFIVTLLLVTIVFSESISGNTKTDNKFYKRSKVISGKKRAKSNKNVVTVKNKTIKGADPIRFKIYSNKLQPEVGEEVELTVTLNLIKFSSSLMYFLPGSNAYTIKMIVPTGFQITSGDLGETIRGELTYPNSTEINYHLRGYFTAPSPDNCFRLLRSHGQATNQSLFEEKVNFCIKSKNNANASSARLTESFSVSLESEYATGTGTINTDPGTSNNQVRWGYSSSNDYLDYILTGANAVPLSGLYALILSYKSISPSTGNIIVNGISYPFSFPSSDGVLKNYATTILLNSGPNIIRIQGGSGRFAQDRIQIVSNLDTNLNCSFTPTASVNNATPGCGASINLSAGCSGGDCSGVSYSWSGNGISLPGQNVTTSVPGSNGTYTYVVMASKAGCTNQTATTTVTLSDCTTSPQSDCTSFAEVCSGNQHEIRYQNITLASAGTYGLSVHYRAPEKQVTGSVFIDGVAQAVVFPQTSSYQDKSVGNITLTGGSHTIGLSSGADGGIICFDKICLSGGTSTNCSFTPTASVNNATPGCGASINLSAGCSGGDCSGVSYSWSGNGISLPGQNVTTSVPGSNGTYTYVVMASKAGCTNQTATTTVTLSDCTTSPQSDCTSFAEVCSGNQHEIRYQNITLASAGTYGLSVHYRAPEKQVTGSVFIDGVAQAVVFPQTSSYQDKSVGNITLTGGSHTIGLSSGADGGIICFDKICLSGGTSTNCSFTPTASVNNATPGCGASINLSAGCSGGDCSGVSYSWSGNGISLPGQNVTTSVPGSNGTYTYVVMASKAGCNLSASVSLNVSGCSSTGYGDMGRAGTRRDQFDIVKSGVQNGFISISDVSNYSVGGYNTLYFINDVYVGNALSNYELPVNAKYVVDKLITKSYPTLGYQRVDDLWKQGSQDSQWIKSWHQQIINTYDTGTPFIGDQIISNGKGTLLPLYQSWFVRSNNWNAEALRSTPALTLPVGKVFGGDALDGTASLDDYHTHGWNIIHRAQIKGQNVPMNERLAYPVSTNFKQSLQNSTLLNKVYLDGNPTYEQGVAAQDYAGYDNFGWLIDQLEEGDDYVRGTSKGYLGYHERFKQKNPSGRTFGNYGAGSLRYKAFTYNFQPEGGGARNPVDFNNYIRRYQSQQQARTRPNGSIDPFYINHDGKSLSSIGVEQLVQYYPMNVNEIDAIYVKMHEIDVMLKQDPNNKPIGYLWPLRENPDGGSLNGDASSGHNSYEWEHETTNPAGRVRQTSHSTCSLISAEVFAFDAMTRGKGVVYFHNLPLTGNDRNKISTSALYPATWLPDPGSSNNFPYVSSNEAGVAPLTPLVGFDATYHGRIKAQRVLDWLGTTTPEWEYATYSLNGTVRNAPSDGTAILHHAADYKPMAMILRNPVNNKKTVWAFDPYCQPNATQNISINLNDGTSVDVLLKGNALHVILIN
ncbi:CBM35 domain-containing protein [Larkinella sp. VNQ87]|uniref:CBM35 domain-containing protein n=1 Tax=Larkinella sp. VNQ87 TaxID=3400921 RepID=UPI003C040AF2